MSQGFYELLGVEPDATEHAVRQAYQARLARLVRRLRSARQSGADVTILEAQERALREAREVLSQPARRRRYDAFRAAIDGGLPESAEALWESVRGALVAPEVSLALASVQALTDLPLGQPVPAPPEPTRVHRVESEAVPAPAPLPQVEPGHGPDRPTLVPRTDPGIEISLSDAELAWLDDPPTPAPVRGPHGGGPVVGPPMLVDGVRPSETQGPDALLHQRVEVEVEPVWADDTWSDTVDTHIPATDPDDLYDDDGDYDDDYDEFAPVAEPTDGPSLPGLGFLSRLSLPKAPSWASGASRPSEVGRGPSLVAFPDDPVPRAERSVGRTGPYLQGVREDRGMSLEDLARSTRISTRYLEAIEADAFDRLPSAIFVQGYVKQVVEQLELDGHGVVEAFMAAYRAQRG